MPFLELVSMRKAFARKDHELTEICDANKFFNYVKQRLNPKLLHQVTTSPLAGSHYPLLVKLKELHYRVNLFVTISIPSLVKSMQAVHGIHTRENK